MPTLEEARRRHAAHYAGLLTRLRDEYKERASRDGVVDRFETEWDQLQAGQAWAASGKGDADLAFLFATSADPLVGLRRRPDILRQWVAPALEHDAAIEDPGIAAENLNRVGQTHYNAGEFEAARDLWKRTLETHRRVDASADPHYFELQEAGYAANLGSAEDRLGNRAAARDAYEHALTVFRRLGIEQQEGRMATNLGTLLASDDAHAEAIVLYERAADIASRGDDMDGLELALGAMGNSLADLERFDEARAVIERALSLSLELGDKSRRALRLGNLARVVLAEGDADAALDLRTEALTLAKEMDEPRTQALQLYGLGQVHADRNDHAKAERCFAEAERIFVALGMHDAAARSREASAGPGLRSAIEAYTTLIADGHHDEALAALDRWTALGHDPTPYQRSVLVGLYAFADHAAGRLDRAAERFAEALTLDRGLPPGELAATHLGNVGDFYRRLGDARHAELCYRDALEIAGVPDGLRENLALGVHAARQLGATSWPEGFDPEVAIDIGVAVANRRLSGEPVDLGVIYLDGLAISGRVASVALGEGLPSITLELAGGLPLDLAFERIQEILPLS